MSRASGCPHEDESHMNKTSYVLLGLLTLSVIGNIV